MKINRIEDGSKITAMWHGQRITGIVESSRIKYGGWIQYAVKLDKPVVRFVDGFREEREFALVNAAEVVDNNDWMA